MGLFLAILANVLGGSTYYVHKVALASWPPAVLAFLRCFVGLVPLLLVMPKGGMAKATRADWVSLAIVGTLGLGLPHLVGMYGLANAHSLNAALLVGMEPIAIVLLAPFFLGEPITRRKLLGIAAGSAGATLIVSRGELGDAMQLGASVRANLLLALHGALWAIYTIGSKSPLERISPITLSAVTTAISMVLLAPAAALEWNEVVPAKAYAAESLALIAALGIGLTFGGTILWNTALKRIPASQMAAVIFLQPLIGAGLGAATGDPFGPSIAAGGAAILAGVWLTQEASSSDRETTPTPPEPGGSPPRSAA